MSPDVEQGLRGDGNDDDAEYVRKLDFHDRIICAGRRHIYWFTNKEDDESERCVNLVAMQNMYMYFLRNQLLDSAAKIVKKKESAKGIAEPKNKDGKTTVEETVENVEETVKKVKETMETAGELLHKYCEAVRDREYMRTAALWESPFNSLKKCVGRFLHNQLKMGKHPWDFANANPFLLSSEMILDRKLMDEKLPRTKFDVHKVLTSSQNKDMAKLPGLPWDYQHAPQAKFERCFMAIIGAAILIGPMIFMTYEVTRTARIGAATTSAGIFALWLAFFSTQTPLEILKTTATYTAILVVFVGTVSYNS